MKLCNHSPAFCAFYPSSCQFFSTASHLFTAMMQALPCPGAKPATLESCSVKPSSASIVTTHTRARSNGAATAARRHMPYAVLHLALAAQCTCINKGKLAIGIVHIGVHRITGGTRLVCHTAVFAQDVVDQA